MIAFEVHVNGQKLCTAGIGELGVLTAMVNWTRARRIDKGGVPEQILDLAVSGLDSSSAEFPSWLRKPITAGDEILIRVVDTTSVDEPLQRSVTPGGPEELEKQTVRMQARQWGWNIKE